MAKKLIRLTIGDMNRARSVGWPSSAIEDYQRGLIAAAGQDPRQVPNEPFRIMRLPEVRQRVALSTSTIYRGISDGTFPRPIPIDRAASVRQRNARAST